MPEKFEKRMERLRKDLEQIYRDTTEALERVTKTQADLVYQATDVITRGYVGVLSGATGGITLGAAGFLDGFSRALERTPKKNDKKRPSSRARGKKKKP